MTINRFLPCKLLAVLSVLLLLTSCATMKFSLFGVTIKAVDETDAPVADAMVSTSDGQQVQTGPNGLAELKFAAVGLQMITVTAPDRAPVNFSVTMPLDMGKTLPAHLGKRMAVGDAAAPGKANTGNAMGGMYLTAMYPTIFQSLFTAYGYNMTLVPYRSGEWTEWNFSEGKKNKQQMVMQKAMLTQLGNGQEWWQVQLTGMGKKEDKMAFEVLFSAERQSIRRMRQQTSGGQVSEVPVTEGWYTAPMQLTPESLEGAVSSRDVSVTVPAGTFRTDLLEFAYMGSAGKVRMWRAQGVPGGVVRVELTNDDAAIWASELKAFGKGAKTVLGSY